MRMRTASRKLLRLRELREERGFSQYDLAQQSGVGRSTIAALETEERGAHPSTTRSLARADGHHRLFWPSDLEEIASPRPSLWRSLLGDECRC